MNDRFKFRVWDKSDECYINVDDCDMIFIEPNGKITIGSYDGDIEDMRYCEEENIVVEQCTGIKDKNGKLIYEGDIVKRGSSIAEVYWDAPCYTIRKKDGRICWLWGNLSEVIGNIHENPELLEAKNG